MRKTVYTQVSTPKEEFNAQHMYVIYVSLRICPHLGVRVCNIFIKARDII